MARVYSEEFHEFLETYGELLDQMENARNVLEVVQDEVLSWFDDLSDELEETVKLLHILEKQVWQFRVRAEESKSIIREQKLTDIEEISTFLPDPSDTEDPFADIWKS